MRHAIKIPGACVVAFLAMLPFKLKGLIGLSWLWVSAPLWIPTVIPLSLLGISFCSYLWNRIKHYRIDR